MSTEKKVKLTSSDRHEFKVEESAAMMSQTVKYMVEDGCADTGIPMANVTGYTLSKVIECCRKHVGAKAEDEEELKAWDKEFVKSDQSTLFNLILASNYLNVKGLLDLTCETVAGMVKGKTSEEIRSTFHIINDFTPEEEDTTRNV